MTFSSPLYIPLLIFAFFYYKKNQKLPIPLGMWTGPLFGIVGLPEPIAPPAPPTPVNPPVCPTCPVCPTGGTCPTPPPCPACPNLDKVKSVPVNVIGTVDITKGGVTTEQPFEFPTYTIGQLPEVYQSFEKVKAKEAAAGVDIQLSNVQVNRVTGSMNPKITQQLDEEIVDWTFQKVLNSSQDRS
jgi:hypothetical protein